MECPCSSYEPVTALLAELNVKVICALSAAITATKVAAMNTISTAYSTAVGPSSLERNRRILEINSDIYRSPRIGFSPYDPKFE
jgi:hypothetical protein